MKTIVENNRMIAEFMGAKLSSVPNLINLPQTIGEERILCVKGSEGLLSGTYKIERINELRYHSSWDWLMPVVEKIESFEDENRCKLYNFLSEQCFVLIVVNHTLEDIVDVDADSRLEATYQAVVKFIEYYNKQKP